MREAGARELGCRQGRPGGADLALRDSSKSGEVRFREMHNLLKTMALKVMIRI